MKYFLPIFFFVVLSAPFSSEAASPFFSNPQHPYIPTQNYGTHCGIDTQNGERANIFSSNYGKAERVIYSNPEPTAPDCELAHANRANMVLIKHLLTTGKFAWSRYLHLYPTNPGLVSVKGKIVTGQKIGEEGRTGYTCGVTGIHLHYEVDTAVSRDSFGALPNSCELNTSATRSTSPSPYLTGGTAQTLLPWFSKSSTSPSSSNYDIFGIAGSPIYGALPLKPTVQTAFTNVGIGGTTYDGSTVSDFFINLSNTLIPTSAPLAGQRTLTAGDYSFYPYSSQFGRGYDVKFSVVPANSEIVDNDGRNVDTSGDSSITNNRQGFFALYDNGALSVPGYYLSASLFAGAGTNWARWFPQNSGNYEVFVHIPRGSTAYAVRYKVYTRGRPADGSCSSTNVTNPCYETDPINQANSPDSWVRLTASNGAVTRFNFVTSSTNSAYVGLSATTPNVPLGYYAGVDAVKFVSSNVTTTAPQINSFTVNGVPLKNGDAISGSYLSSFNLVLTFNQAVTQVNRELPVPYGLGYFGTSSNKITWSNLMYGFRAPLVGDMRIYPIDSAGNALPNFTPWVIKLNLY